MSSLMMCIATFRLHTANLHQAIRSTGFGHSYKAGCSAVTGCFFHSCDWRVSILGSPLSYVSPVVVFLIVGIHASGIYIPLSLLMLLGWSHCFTKKKDKVKMIFSFFQSVTTFCSSCFLNTACSYWNDTLRLECSIPWVFGTRFSSQHWHSSHNHISHTPEVLDFHLLVQQYTHSGHKIKLVRSSTYHSFNKLF